MMSSFQNALILIDRNGRVGPQLVHFNPVYAHNAAKRPRLLVTCPIWESNVTVVIALRM